MRQALTGPFLTHVSLASAILVLGTLVYVLDRPAQSAPLFSVISLSAQAAPVFGAVGQSFPTFAHVFAFSLLTAVLLGSSRRAAYRACMGWFTVDTAFELGQHAAIATTLADLIPTSLADTPILIHTRNYFVSGTFDPHDLFSIAVGALSAYLVIRFADGYRRHD